MKSAWITLNLIILLECGLLVLGTPVTTGPSVEYVESPSATDRVVFDEPANNEDDPSGTTELPAMSGSLSDEVPQTTEVPCGNGLDSSLDCTIPMTLEIQSQNDEAIKTDFSDNNQTESSSNNGDKTEVTTLSPQEN